MRIGDAIRTACMLRGTCIRRIKAEPIDRDMLRAQPCVTQVLDTLKRLPELRCLYLKGNPVVSAIPQYRRTLVAALPGLTYLDDRPVFPMERRCAEAWRAQAPSDVSLAHANSVSMTLQETHSTYHILQQLRKSLDRNRAQTSRASTKQGARCHRCALVSLQHSPGS